MSWLQYHLKMVCFGLGNKNKWCTHCADGGLELGWMVLVGFLDTAFKVGCTGVHAYVTSGLYHCHPPVVTLALPVGFLTKDPVQGPL